MVHETGGNSRLVHETGGTSRPAPEVAGTSGLGAHEGARQTGGTPGWGFAGAALAVYLLGLGLLVGVTLWLNQGAFAYSLDDPYLHLGLAENLARGHYGLNAEEPSSPSSSALWPWLLAPLAGLERFELVPLALNVVLMAVTVLVLVWLLGARLCPPLSRRALAAVLLLLGLACNLWGLPLNGMEHCAQVLLAVLAAAGVLELVEQDRVPAYLPIGLALGPLVRFENASLLVLGAAVLALRGRRLTALATLAAAGAPLALYFAYLSSQGLPWLPSSVLVKSEIASAGGPLTAIFEVLENVGESLLKSRIQLALVLLVVLARRVHRAPGTARAERDRLYLLFAGGIVTAHMLAGRYDWFGRYEVYLMVAVAVILLPAYAADLARLVAGRRRLALAGLVLAALWAGKHQVLSTLTTPWSANNIYQMHGQMHRFAVDYWRDATGVNDVGWISFRNPYPVLDLWGLASEEARRLRKTSTGNAWAERLAAEHGVDLLMIFEDWFIELGPLPPSWDKVAALTVAGPAIQVPHRTIDFFLRNSTRRRELVLALEAFRPTLPPGVELVIHDPARDVPPL